MTRRIEMSRTALAIAVLAGSASAVLAGPEWTEVGDSGSNLPGAQTPTGPGPITGIKGELTGGIPRGIADFEDVYRIIIDDPASFSAFIVPNANGTPTFDTQLFLFNRFGEGVIANDDNTIAGANGESGFFNNATDGSGASVMNPDIYFLAISGGGNAPRDRFSDTIFDFLIPGEVSGPDGSSDFLDRWSGPGAIGEYTIALSGVIALSPQEAADLNHDGCIDSQDLAILLAAWGTQRATDLNNDGITDSGDLAILLAAWGCPITLDTKPALSTNDTASR